MLRQWIFVYLVEFNEKSQNLLNLKLKQKIVKFAKFVTAFNPGHKWEIGIQNNCADNAFPCETWFSHSLEKTRFSHVSIVHFKHSLAVIY